VICGAGHVGASLAKLASLMGYRATLIDDRAEFVTREYFPDRRIELVAAASWSKRCKRRLATDTELPWPLSLAGTARMNSASEPQ